MLSSGRAGSSPNSKGTATGSLSKLKAGSPELALVSRTRSKDLELKRYLGMIKKIVEFRSAAFVTQPVKNGKRLVHTDPRLTKL
jgi:hypothetical protein